MKYVGKIVYYLIYTYNNLYLAINTKPSYSILTIE